MRLGQTPGSTSLRKISLLLSLGLGAHLTGGRGIVALRIAVLCVALSRIARIVAISVVGSTLRHTPLLCIAPLLEASIMIIVPLLGGPLVFRIARSRLSLSGGPVVARVVGSFLRHGH